MAIRIDTSALQSEISKTVKNALGKVDTGDLISTTLTDQTRLHVSQKYPGSTHWSLDKIVKGVSTTNEGSVDVNVDGATRAYNDITILPIHGSYLTIPILEEAKGKTVADYDGLFRPKGKDYLAKVMEGNLVAIFALVQSAFQPKDSSLMPKDENFCASIENRWILKLFSEMKSQ